MKTISVLLIGLFISISSSAQEITGEWSGVLKVQEVSLRIVFKVSKTINGYTSTMDSPDQGVSGIQVTKTTFKNLQVRFEIADANIVFTGELKDKEIAGTFIQNGQKLPLILSKK